MEESTVKIGVLGGGQLGLMLYEANDDPNIELHFLDKKATFPALQKAKHFTLGDFKDYDTVMAFGKNMDVVSIEIEAVNAQALKDLAQLGVKVFPQGEIVEMIQDKGLQKEFYIKESMPTAPFFLAENKTQILAGIEEEFIDIPFVQKARKGGYDGKGVQLIKSKQDLEKIWDIPSVIEDKIEIDKELAVIVARTATGQTKTFPSVEMSFHPTANLVEFLFSPSAVAKETESKAQQLAQDIIESLGMIGILAVEMFLTKSGELLINEIAPRPHNSGHHTIEGNKCSQYKQLLNVLAQKDLEDTALLSPAVMINLLGEEGHIGKAKYEGTEHADKENIFVHLYGKETTKPNRKMGHVTVIDANLDKAIESANFVKSKIKVIS